MGERAGGGEAQHRGCSPTLLLWWLSGGGGGGDTCEHTHAHRPDERNAAEIMQLRRQLVQGVAMVHVQTVTIFHTGMNKDAAKRTSTASPGTPLALASQGRSHPLLSRVRRRWDEADHLQRRHYSVLR